MIAELVAALALAAPAHHYRPHDPGCQTRACDRRVDEAWADWEAWVSEPGHPYYPSGKPDRS